MVERLGALTGTRVRRDRSELGPDGSSAACGWSNAPSRYAAMHFSGEKTVRRAKM